MTAKNIFRATLAALAVSAVVGCGSSNSSGNGSSGNGSSGSSKAATYVYVIQNPLSGGTGEVLAFAAGANGSTAPAVPSSPLPAWISSP